jgi:hypothetical protein
MESASEVCTKNAKSTITRQRFIGLTRIRPNNCVFKGVFLGSKSA